MIDLAARGLVRFRQDDQFMRKKTQLGVTGQGEIPSTPEAGLYQAISRWADPEGFVPVTTAKELLPAISTLKDDLEGLAVQKGWLTAKPSRVVAIWIIAAVLEGAAALPLIFWTLQLDASGGLLGGAVLLVAAVATGVIAWFMPCRTKLGAMLRAMLAAYKRTLQHTLADSASMDEVVGRKALPWVTTPDAAMAWGVAFGLNADIEAVLQRTVNASVASGRQTGWYPLWFAGPGYSGGFGVGSGGGTPGLYSGSAIPDIGSMMSSLGSIGSTGGGANGGSFGGGGGGGGGGAGGGF
jgi:hypothetical protein